MPEHTCKPFPGGPPAGHTSCPACQSNTDSSTPAREISSPDTIIGKLGEYRRYDEYVRAEKPDLPGDERQHWEQVVDHRWGPYVAEAALMFRVKCPCCGDVLSCGDYDENTYYDDIDCAIDSTEHEGCPRCGWSPPGGDDA